MVFEHDFKNFPELTNGQMNFYYFDSPHKQLTENFDARVVKVIDGDTIRVTMKERDFDFPIRLLKIAAPERDERGGLESQRWLASEILGKDVEIIMDQKNRVEKWGRLLGEVVFHGFNMGEMSVTFGYSVPFEERKQGGIPDFFTELDNL